MLQIKEMQPDDRAAVLPMVQKFYHSDAVDHAVDAGILQKTFEDAVSDNPALRGVTLWEQDQIVGFAYLTTFYACEVCGITVMIEEIYIDTPYQGKGYGTAFFKWLFGEYPDAARFRLEVTDENKNAIRLYEKLGFSFLSYRQMVKELRG